MAAKTSVFLCAAGEWQPSVTRPTQPISSIMLHYRVKECFLENVGGFLDPASRGQYHGPYRRCYLFHGPPGTGKTCLALAIAGHFGLDVYIVCLPVNDGDLKTLFARVPRRSIIVLEDVDNASSQPREGTACLSALLDAIDSAGDGRLIIMTTRHIELVDGALMEPDRVVMTTEFGLADKEMIAGLFRFAYDHEAAGPLAEKFAAKIPEREFSPAEMMSYFASNFQSPEAAISGVEKWMATVRYEREKMGCQSAK
jgi:chaperone BCS1